MKRTPPPPPRWNVHDKGRPGSHGGSNRRHDAFKASLGPLHDDRGGTHGHSPRDGRLHDQRHHHGWRRRRRLCNNAWR